MGGREPLPLWTFLTFTQNYQLQPGTAFSRAWSVCIEEQFYAVFPLVVLVAWSFAVWVASALAPTSPLYRVPIPGAYTLALWSYAIYLIHKPVGYLFRQHASTLTAGWMLLAVSASSIVLGAALYYLVETPFMRLRDGWFPSLRLPPRVTATTWPRLG